MSVHGAALNPMSGTSSLSSFLMSLTASMTCLSLSLTSTDLGTRFSRSSGPVRGFGTWMPTPPGMVTSMFRASAITRMSEKRIAASRLYLRMGCMVHSATSLGSFRSSTKFLPVAFLYASYSGRWRPACLNNHTGVLSTFSPRAARTIRSFFSAMDGAPASPERPARVPSRSERSLRGPCAVPSANDDLGDERAALPALWPQDPPRMLVGANPRDSCASTASTAAPRPHASFILPGV
mmetsp:Transcript_28264/g.69905  ORF Transcript_28264/g.69905 Transcript_28264/m.69905 type:complete len:237 (-) Transcript_28264:3-713(-)